MGEKVETLEDRLSNGEVSSDEDFADDESLGEENDTVNTNAPKKSGMANVISRILSKDTSKSSRLFLTKGKTDREIVEDIKRRRQKRQEKGIEVVEEESAEKEISLQELRSRETKRRLWDKMSRKTPSLMDISKETKLRKIATKGMVQLFQSVHDHQKIMNQKIKSVGASERKKDKVLAEFTKGKFLDVLKSKTGSQATVEKDSEKDDTGGGKWKILKDDFMMGAQMKDWDKDDDEDDEDDNDNTGNHDKTMSEEDMSD